MTDILPNMYKNTESKPPGFLQLCLDNRRENIARYLINNGVEMWEDIVVRVPTQHGLAHTKPRVGNWLIVLQLLNCKSGSYPFTTHEHMTPKAF